MIDDQDMYSTIKNLDKMLSVTGKSSTAFVSNLSSLTPTGIIYAPTRARVDQIARALSQQHGYSLIMSI
jgi:superfamily II DNA helicase RecQ